MGQTHTVDQGEIGEVEASNEADEMIEVDGLIVVAEMIEEAEGEADRALTKVDRIIHEANRDISKVGRAFSKPNKAIRRLISTISRADKIPKINNTEKTTMAKELKRRRIKRKTKRRKAKRKITRKMIKKTNIRRITKAKPNKPSKGSKTVGKVMDGATDTAIFGRTTPVIQLGTRMAVHLVRLVLRLNAQLMKTKMAISSESLDIENRKYKTLSVTPSILPHFSIISDHVDLKQFEQKNIFHDISDCKPDSHLYVL